MSSHLQQVVFVGLASLPFLIGCVSKAKRVEQPEYDPAAISAGAISTYDTSGDGLLNAEELALAGSLRDHAEQVAPVIDKNADGNVSAEEIAARVEQWIERKTGLQTFQVQVNQAGKPLAGATVRLVPEPFMGGVVPPATGQTDESGAAILGIDDSELPADLSGRKFVKPGFYKIEITHPSAKIPVKFNTETTLGQEISDEAIGSINFVYDVK